MSADDNEGGGVGVVAVGETYSTLGRPEVSRGCALERHAIVQIDPRTEVGRRLGPQLVIVIEERQWGLIGYYVQTSADGPQTVYVHLLRGAYAPIVDGRAIWVSE